MQLQSVRLRFSLIPGVIVILYLHHDKPVPCYTLRQPLGHFDDLLKSIFHVSRSRNSVHVSHDLSRLLILHSAVADHLQRTSLNLVRIACRHSTHRNVRSLCCSRLKHLIAYADILVLAPVYLDLA